MSLLGKAGLAGAVGLVGAYGQDPRRTQHSKQLTPEENTARVRKMRLLGAANALGTFGGAVLGYKKPQMSGAGALGSSIVGGATSHLMNDDTYLRRVVPRLPGESDSAYRGRLSQQRNLSTFANTAMSGFASLAGSSLAREFRDAGVFSRGARNMNDAAYEIPQPTTVAGYKKEVLQDRLARLADLGIDTSGLEQATTKEELRAALKKAYRAAARVNHPDRGGSGEAMSHLNPLRDELEEGMGKLAFYRALYARAR